MEIIDEKYIVKRFKENNRIPVFIDLSNVAYRSAFVFTPDKFKTSQGIPNGHLFGVCQVMKTLLNLNYEVYLCRDLQSNFRKRLNENYKANRQTEDSGISVHSLLNRAINPLISELQNVHVLSKTNYEADDIMFSASKYCSSNEIKCWIMSTDKDLCQALDNNISIAHKFTIKGPQEIVTTDSEYYIKNFGDIKPRCLPLYRAFKGDASDNLDAPVKRFPKDLLEELCNDYENRDYSDEIAVLLLSHKCSKKSHEKWMKQLTTDRDIFIQLYNNYRIMKLNPIPIEVEDEPLVENAFNIITDEFELWGFKKFVKEYNLGGN